MVVGCDLNREDYMTAVCDSRSIRGVDPGGVGAVGSRVRFAALALFCRRLWREATGYNANRRRRIAKRKLARAFDDAERRIEELKERSNGLVRIQCVNDLAWVRMQRSFRGV